MSNTPDGSQFRKFNLKEVTAVSQSPPTAIRIADLEQALTQRTEELAKAQKELQEIVYIASHDLQEPLRMIKSFLELLEKRCKEKLDKDAQEFIEFAVDGAERQQQLLDGLLVYSRISTRGKPLVRTDCQIVFEQVFTNLKPVIAECDASVMFNHLPAVMADAVQLKLLFHHLLNNALKFRSQRPPLINVFATRQDDVWHFSISDNGIGIPPEARERVFSIFQRLHARGKYEGSGVGLAICKKIVERHNGRIWLKSVPGIGTTFIFTLPAISASEDV